MAENQNTTQVENITPNMTPSEYFEIVKSRKQNVTDEMLLQVYDNCLSLLNKYKITGQTAGMKKLLFHLQCVEAEREIVRMGITTFIYRDDIEEYIDTIADDAVKIIEIEKYEREIPDEIVALIEQVKGKFSKLYVLFTDYTGKIERKVEKERRQKDPILFGVFQNEHTQTVIDRFYFLGDWEDEYCDLTLDKMVGQFAEVGRTDVVKTIKTPEDIEELRKQLEQLSPSSKLPNVEFKIEPEKKPGFFKRIRTVFGGEKK